jgi:hypothetical protein
MTTTSKALALAGALAAFAVSPASAHGWFGLNFNIGVPFPAPVYAYPPLPVWYYPPTAPTVVCRRRGRRSPTPSRAMCSTA